MKEKQVVIRLYGDEYNFVRSFIKKNNIQDKLKKELVTMNKFCSAIVRGWLRQEKEDGRR